MFELTDVRVIREQRTILAIDNLTIPNDAFTVVLGHNGSGKSTMVNLLSGQFAPEQGQVLLNGKAVTAFAAKELAKAIAYLPQKLPDAAGLTVRELVRLGRFPWRGTFGRWQAEDEQFINDAMAQTGTAAFADTLADSLSGGERQRAWIAMLLAQQSPLLILDEPTSALDVGHQYQLMELLAKFNAATGRGVIVILHDINLALRYASHVVALHQGKLAFAGDKTLLHDEQRISGLYGADVRLVDHPLPQVAGANEKVAVIC